MKDESDSAECNYDVAGNWEEGDDGDDDAFQFEIAYVKYKWKVY